jgi:hypothetical protein
MPRSRAFCVISLAKWLSSPPRFSATATAASFADFASIVVDGNSGAVLQASNPDALRHPASLTKIMTLYLLFERLDAGKIKIDSILTVSEHASEQAVGGEYFSAWATSLVIARAAARGVRPNKQQRSPRRALELPRAIAHPVLRGGSHPIQTTGMGVSPVSVGQNGFFQGTTQPGVRRRCRDGSSVNQCKSSVGKSRSERYAGKSLP